MQTIYRSEGSASLRRVPIWLADSTGTGAPATQAGGQPQICWHARGVTTVNTSGTLSAVSINGGLYHVELTASEVSALGILSLHYRAASVVPQVVFAQVVNYDSGDSIRQGLFALPNAVAEAAGGLITHGTGTGQLHTSSGSVGLKAQVHSDVTILGVLRADVGLISGDAGAADNLEAFFDGTGYASAGSITGVTNVNSGVSIRAGSHSGATIQGLSNYANISNVTLHAGTHSSVTIQGVTRVNSAVTLNADTHSGATIQGISNYANISNVTLHAGTHSDVTIKGLQNYANISNVTLHAGSHSGATIDGVRMLATPAERSIASSLLSTNLGGTRTVQQAFHAIRNKVLMSGSTGTVYLADDTTSDWTFTVSTGTATVYGIDPGIA